MRNMDADMSLKSYKKSVALVRQKDNRTCAYCLTKLSDGYERKMHEQTIHEKISSKHKCNECGKLFTNSTSLNYHLERHANIEKLICEQCDKTFVSKNGLDIHIEIAHNNEGEKYRNFLCEICNKAFTTSSNLARHRRVTHYTSRANLDFADSFKYVNEFQCDQCEKMFKRKDKLKRHQQTVLDANFKIECPSCDKIFKRKDKLTEHIRSEHETVSGV